MKNIKINQVNANIQNGWVVNADTKRFGTDAIMFEGNFDECMEYIQEYMFGVLDVEHFVVHITGLNAGRRMDNEWVKIHSNGYTELMEDYFYLQLDADAFGI